MKPLPPRDPRTTVRLTVRIRADGGWADATIHNLSHRGMMVHSQYPLRRNQYVEIARGRTRVVGRIVWTADSACGLRAQDAIDMGALLGQPSTERATLREERRAPVRAGAGSFAALSFSERGEVARRWGRGLEFTVMVAAIAITATLAVDGALAAAAAPLEQVRLALVP